MISQHIMTFFFWYQWKGACERVSTYYIDQIVYQILFLTTFNIKTIFIIVLLFQIFIRHSIDNLDFWKPQVVCSFWTQGFFLVWGTWKYPCVIYIYQKNEICNGNCNPRRSAFQQLMGFINPIFTCQFYTLHTHEHSFWLFISRLLHQLYVLISFFSQLETFFMLIR